MRAPDKPRGPEPQAPFAGHPPSGFAREEDVVAFASAAQSDSAIAEDSCSDDVAIFDFHLGVYARF